MDPRLKHIVHLLWNDQIPFKTLTEALAPLRSTLELNEVDRIFALDTVKRLQRELMEKKSGCN